MKKLSYFFVGLALMAVTTSCEKEGPVGPAGPQGAQGPAGAPGAAGPQAKTFNFSLTFDPGETYEEYTGITGFNADDVLLVYVHWATYGGSPYWVQLPFAETSDGISIYPEFSGTNGHLYINTVWADGTSGSPWTTSAPLNFRAVLISSSIKKANPDVNWNNYEEVKQVLDLQD